MLFCKFFTHFFHLLLKVIKPSRSQTGQFIFSSSAKSDACLIADIFSSMSGVPLLVGHREDRALHAAPRRKTPTHDVRHNLQSSCDLSPPIS